MTTTRPLDPDATLDHLERSLIAGRHDRRGFIKAMTATGLATTGLHAWAAELDAMHDTGAVRGTASEE